MIGCPSPFYGATKKEKLFGNFQYCPPHVIEDLPTFINIFRNNMETLARHLSWLNNQKDFRMLMVPYFIIPTQLATARNHPRVQKILFNYCKSLIPLLKNTRLIIGRYPLLGYNRKLSEIELLTDFASWTNSNNVVILAKIGAQPNAITQCGKIIAQLSENRRHLIALCNDEYIDLPDIARLPIRIVPDIFAWWVKSGKYIKAADPAWKLIKANWQSKPIIIASISSWASAIWSLPFMIKANYMERLMPHPIDFEHTPIDYIEKPKKKVMLQRCSFDGISRRGEGMWHIGLLDDALEYLNWSDVLFDIMGHNLAMSHISTRLEELNTNEFE